MRCRDLCPDEHDIQDRIPGAQHLDKSQILDLLRSQGDDEKAQQADGELPEQIDTDRDGGLLDGFGLDVGDLMKKFGGGGLGKLIG